MYLRETRRRNVDGSEVCYVALAHNERDKDTGVSKPKVIHNFGRADQLDRAALARLVRSLSRFLEPAQAMAASVSGEVEILEARATLPRVHPERGRTRQDSPVVTRPRSWSALKHAAQHPNWPPPRTYELRKSGQRGPHDRVRTWLKIRTPSDQGR